MARLHFKKTRGKAYLADEELMEYFRISDPSVIRSMTGKARKALKRFVVYRDPDQNGLSMLIEKAYVDGKSGRTATVEIPVRDMDAWDPDQDDLLMLIEKASVEGKEGRTVPVAVPVRDMHVWIWWFGLKTAIRCPIGGVRDSKELRQKWPGKWPPPG
jgi:hypothetical protein